MLTDLLGTTIPRLAAPFLRDVTWRGPGRTPDGHPCLYLTFDDGPHPESTPLLLDYLRSVGVPATFFFLGSQAERFPDLVRATVEAGHGIGNHGWRHRSPWSAPRSETLNDFARAEVLLEDLTGLPVRRIRPPYGRFTPALRKWGREDGRRLVLWDLMPGDFLSSSRSTERLVERVSDQIVHRARPGSIVVLHESAHSLHIVPPALDRALPLLSAGGWKVGSL